jgi:hypothetical protein
MSGDRTFGRGVVRQAWRELPAEARSLLESIREIYAMLMTRRRFDGAADRPLWLPREVY